MNSRRAQSEPWLVVHEYETDCGCEMFKIIGLYSGRAKARAAVSRLRKKPGFKDHASGFRVWRPTLDLTAWEDGFISAADALEELRAATSKAPLKAKMYGFGSAEDAQRFVAELGKSTRKR